MNAALNVPINCRWTRRNPIYFPAAAPSNPFLTRVSCAFNLHRVNDYDDHENPGAAAGFLGTDTGGHGETNRRRESGICHPENILNEDQV